MSGDCWRGNYLTLHCRKFLLLYCLHHLHPDGVIRVTILLLRKMKWHKTWSEVFPPSVLHYLWWVPYLLVEEADCFDKSDEHNLLCGCIENYWPCLDGERCISNELVCDGALNCPDFSDESHKVYCFIINT